MFDPIPERVEQYATDVLNAAFQVHRNLGPGLLESVYETCLCHELQKLQVPFKRQVALPIQYDGVTIEGRLRLDLQIDQLLIVELKAVEHLLPIHEAQVYTYLKLANNRLGILLNFNTKLLKDGIKRIII